ncbi:MAG: cobalamin-binding protein [Deltaproteobacteria bacterium]|nr:cobalamin-binding protein [Deltaproteobacteria bacterium]
MGIENLIRKMTALSVVLLAFFFLPAVSYAAMYIDEIGRNVDIGENPKRIVSLAPNITETLFALGLEKEIVGVTVFSNYPEAAREKARIGSFVNISLEKIVALSPELVIATANGNRKKSILKLAEVGIPVYVISPEGFEDIFKTIMNIGRITGRADEATILVDNLRQRVDRVRLLTRNLKKPRVFFQIGIDPIVSVGRNTIHSRLITLAGGINIFGDVEIEYPRTSIEKVIMKRPDVIIISSMKRGGKFDQEKNKWNVWKDIPAVNSDRIHVIDSDLTDHFSTRIVDGLEELFRLIHQGTDN